MTEVPARFNSISFAKLSGPADSQQRQWTGLIENSSRVLDTLMTAGHNVGGMRHRHRWQHHVWCKERLSFGGCIAQRNHSCFPPSSPGFKSWLRQDFFSLLLSLWTVSRSNPFSCAKQWISQMLLAVTSWAKCYKKVISWRRLRRSYFGGSQKVLDFAKHKLDLQRFFC